MIIIDKKSKKNNNDEIECEYYKIAKKILKEQFPSLPKESFDKVGNKCFCIKCHTKRGDGNIYQRGKPLKNYGIPIKWARFGLKTDNGFCKIHNVWNNWHVGYHGTSKDTVCKIFDGKLMLLKPGDIAIGGNKLNIKSGHIKKPFKRYNKYTKKYEMFDPNQIYISPSIKYSGN
eukprot:182989_1